jgi:hypothetical protein
MSGSRQVLGVTSRRAKDERQLTKDAKLSALVFAKDLPVHLEGGVAKKAALVVILSDVYLELGGLPWDCSWNSFQCDQGMSPGCAGYCHHIPLSGVRLAEGQQGLREAWGRSIGWRPRKLPRPPAKPRPLPA